MLDIKILDIRAGSGGVGSISFLRERHRPRGGPDGGDGGRGGSVIVRASKDRRTLAHLRRATKIIAKDGVSGKGQERTGANAGAVVIEVPEGTQVWRIGEGAAKTALVADLLEAGQEAVVAQGGAGGRGNSHFKSATNQAPKLAETGELGAEDRILLEVKLLADVALVGLPNAGKSTLLRNISRARPEVGDYPFTTIEPHLGVAEVQGRALTFMDVPGLIEGAHLGRGLGLEFLRHVERGAIIVTLLDGASSDIRADYESLRSELQKYGGGLESKHEIVVLNKTDRTDVRERLLAARDALRPVVKDSVVEISGATGAGVPELMQRVLFGLAGGEGEERAPRQAPPASTVPVPTRRESAQVIRDGGAFIVTHGPAERLINRINLEDWETRMQLHQELGRIGILKMLRAAGVRAGDTVRIGSTEMEWE